eukprot:Awhi_evm1s13773
MDQAARIACRKSSTLSSVSNTFAIPAMSGHDVKMFINNSRLITFKRTPMLLNNERY